MKMQQFFNRHGATILTGAAIFWFAGSVQQMPDATRRADYILANTNPETTVDKVKLVWQEYIPVGLCFGAGVACVLGANSLHLKNTAGLASLLAMTEGAYSEYRNKVVTKIGEIPEREIRDEIAIERAKQVPMDSSILIVGANEVLCLETLSGRYFKGNVEAIRRSMNDINFEVRTEMWVPLNHWYNELGLKHNDTGDILGWTNDNPLDIYFTAGLTEKNEPYLVISYINSPIHLGAA